jgi:hypothetical protein
MPFFLDWTILLVPVVFSLAFIIPGTLLLYPIRFKPFETLTLGSGLGIALWAIQGFIFGFLGVRFLTYAYIIITFTIWSFLIVKHRNKLRKYLLPIFKIDLVSCFLVFVGAILALSAVWFMGVKTQDGLFFCCRGVPDAIYHLSLTNELVNHFPPREPGMSSLLVKNYHYLSNLVVADIVRVFKLDFMAVQFRYINLFLVIIFGASAFVFSSFLGLKKTFARWLVVFFFASGDIIYVLLFLRGRGLNFEVTILDDATKLFAGPPRALSVVLFFCALCLFIHWINKKSLYAGFLSALVFGTLAGFKIYTGIFALTGLGAVSIYFLYKKKYLMLLPLFVTLLMTGVYVYFVNNNAGGLYFDGIGRFLNFIQENNLSLLRLYFYYVNAQNSGNFVAHFLLGGLFAILYYIFLFGTINFGIFQTKKSLSLLPLELNIFLVSGIFVSLFLGSFFLQNTGGSNTVQLIVFVFIVGSIYASLSIYYWGNKLGVKNKFIIYSIVLLITIPRAFHESFENFMNVNVQRGLIIGNSTLDALNYLKLQTPPDSIVMLEPQMANDEAKMYISFLTQRRQFLSGFSVLKDHGQDAEKELNVNNEIFNSTDSQLIKTLLIENKIGYIYLTENYNLVNSSLDYTKSVYNENNIQILKINP